MDNMSVHRRLDKASQGLIRDLAAACRDKKLKPYVMAEKDGEEGMRLIGIGFDADGKTGFFDTAKLSREAHMDGWRLMAAEAAKLTRLRLP